MFGQLLDEAAKLTHRLVVHPDFNIRAGLLHATQALRL